MYPMSYSFKIQNIFSKLTEFITLKFLAHKVREFGFRRAIPDCQFFFFDLVREEKIFYVQISCPFPQILFTGFSVVG